MKGRESCWQEEPRAIRMPSQRRTFQIDVPVPGKIFLTGGTLGFSCSSSFRRAFHDLKKAVDVAWFREFQSGCGDYVLRGYKLQ